MSIDTITRIFSFLIILIIIWIWYMNHNHPDCYEYWIDDVLLNCKTGDLILFKATDNYNSSKIFSYYTHIGVIYKPNIASLPMIFEAQYPHGLELYEFENQTGIYITDLKTRITRNKGRLYYKPLNNCVNDELNAKFQSFINYASQNMYYNDNVLWNGIKKGIFNERLYEGTNCGELTLLSLIKLGILNPTKYYTRTLHHLYWMANIETCDDGFVYLPIVKIKISPFR